MALQNGPLKAHTFPFQKKKLQRTVEKTKRLINNIVINKDLYLECYLIDLMTGRRAI